MNMQTALTIIIPVITILSSLIGLITPMMKLIRTIQRLSDTIDRLVDSDSRRQIEIESLTEKVMSHEVQLATIAEAMKIK